MKKSRDFKGIKDFKDVQDVKEVTARESDSEHGLRVWRLGQISLYSNRDCVDLNVFHANKVKTMFLINAAKYREHKDLQQQLMNETGPKNNKLKGAHSTWEWTKWNGAIQTYIKKLLVENAESNENEQDYDPDPLHPDKLLRGDRLMDELENCAYGNGKDVKSSGA